MQKLIFLLLFQIILTPAFADNQKAAYQLFDRDGEPVHYEDMLSTAATSGIVMFGELHNNPIAHWLQLELATDLYGQAGDGLVLGAEMLETDNQVILDEYFEGLIMQNHFESEARLWNNYETDYRPLVEFARENGLYFIATNIPRRYASMVHRGGFEALEELTKQAQSWIAPLPVPYDPDLPGYRAMLEMEGMPAHGTENFPKAQAIKDATMAHFILQNMPDNGIFLHFHGAYHSNNDEGIVWYLHEYSEEALQVMTISTVEQQSVDQLQEEHRGLADFIIAVPANMTKTY